MDISSKELCQSYIIARHQNPAWQLLAARRAPLVLSCLKSLFEQNQDGIAFEDAQQLLAEILAQHANEFDIENDDYPAIARKELRDWIKRGLVIERAGQLIATDALQQALHFIDGLNNRMMTSTASRLATVQREIENLELSLNPDQQSRTDHLKRKIQSLEEELIQVESGNIKIMEGTQAVEGIREVYNLALSLRADFRRVEDSYREADHKLRQSIISELHHRGEIVDKLLDGHEALLETVEGQVFHGFYDQLSHSVELDNMKQRLRNILKNPATETALNPQQQTDLRRLDTRLVKESSNVIRARARSERDVKGFLKTGLAAEHHRVGELLNEILDVALDFNWGSTVACRSPSPLPPIGITLAGLPLMERLRFKSVEQDGPQVLELSEQTMDLDELEDDFWQVFDTLDRQALFEETLELLTVTGQKMSIADLIAHLPPTHDLETLTLWLSMAREAEVPIHPERESVDIEDTMGQTLRFHVPKVELSAEPLKTIDWEL